MQGGLTFLFWGYKEQNKPNIGLECLSTSNGTATFLSTLNINQIYNLYFRFSSYSGFIILSTLRPLHTHTHTHTHTQQKKIFLEDICYLWLGKDSYVRAVWQFFSDFTAIDTKNKK